MMKEIIKLIQRKLSIRVSLWVVLFAAIIFNIALGFFFYQARSAVRQEAINRAMQTLEKTSLRVEGILNRVEVATNMTEWLVKRHPDVADSMFVYSRGMLLNNPDFYNCSIAFEPYYFKDKGLYFSAYSKHMGDSVRTIQGGSDLYQYFYTDWYLMPTLLDQPCWTEPYMDIDAPTNTSEMVTSFCRAIKDDNGKIIGVINTSLSINWLSQTISAVKPYPNSYSIMIGRGGTYFVHPDSTKITRQTIFTQTFEEPDTALTALGHAMQHGEEGMKQMHMNGQKCYVFYKPLGKTGCSMAIVCPESDIFGGFDHLRNSVRAIVLVGLLLMLFFFIRIITTELKPLRRLAEEAETIASGHFETKLPELQRIDEIGQLSNSFSGMQHSLVKYIEELKDTTAQKASIESDLRIASGIQMAMLPKIFPPYPERDDIDIYGKLVSAKEVGGDLFDFFIRDEKLFFCIGDVSGKGVPAALVMAVTRALFRAVAAHESMPDRIINNMNETLSTNNESDMFVTMFIGVLDLLSGRMRYCNAGHDVPILIGSGIGMLPCDSNIPVGVMQDWVYTLQETTIDPLTTIFLYTDGLTEAEDINHAQFQEKRIIDVIQQAPNEPQQIILAMTQAVHQFVGNAEQSDDLTMLALQYKRQQPHVRYQRSLTLPNDVQTIQLLNEFVDNVCEAAGFDISECMRMNLAIEEAVVNVMNYAYPKGVKGMVNIDATINDKGLKFVISDNGTPFDPTAKEEVDTTLSAEERGIGGLGIHLIRQIMDSINYEHIDGRNVLTLLKRI
ncbi:MAG: SpoIIE family protein phosphatase [Bacteroidaceae bacterium]|nr:SpoIIE family protein phosphatase [Bacteroidaceae bacterium]